MAKPSDKSPEMEKAIDTVVKTLGFLPRRASIEGDICVTCGAKAPPESFRDALSVKEYSISGMCQRCQDGVFGSSPDVGNDGAPSINDAIDDIVKETYVPREVQTTVIKVQRPLFETGAPGPVLWLLYDEHQDILLQIEPNEFLVKLMDGDLKMYVAAEVHPSKDGGFSLIFKGRVPEQPW